MEQLYLQFKNDLCVTMYTTIPNKHTYSLIPDLLQASSWGHSPPQLVPLIGHAPPHPSSFQLAQASFEPNSYMYKYPSSLVPVILLVHTTFEDGTECSETSAHKIQMPGNHTKERIQHTYTYSHM